MNTPFQDRLFGGLTELEHALAEDFSAEHANALLAYLARAGASGAGLLGESMAESRRDMLGRLVAGCDAAQRVVRRAWETMHGVALVPQDATPVARGRGQLFHVLMTLGLLGLLLDIEDDAEVVNDAVEATFEDPSEFRACRAIVQALRGDITLAQQMLLDLCATRASTDQLKVDIGRALALACEPGWKTLVDEVMASSLDQGIRYRATCVARMAGKACAR